MEIGRRVILFWWHSIMHRKYFLKSTGFKSKYQCAEKWHNQLPNSQTCQGQSIVTLSLSPTCGSTSAAVYRGRLVCSIQVTQPCSMAPWERCASGGEVAGMPAGRGGLRAVARPFAKVQKDIC